MFCFSEEQGQFMDNPHNPDEIHCSVEFTNVKYN